MSIRSRQASNASPRCGAETAATTATVADLEVAHAVHRGQPGDVVAGGDLAAYPRQGLDDAGVGRVVEGRHRRAVVVVAHHADEQGDAPAPGVLHRAASTSSTLSGSSRTSLSTTVGSLSSSVTGSVMPSNLSCGVAA